MFHQGDLIADISKHCRSFVQQFNVEVPLPRSYWLIAQSSASIIRSLEGRYDPQPPILPSSAPSC